MEFDERIINGLLLTGFLFFWLVPVWAVFYFGASRAFESRAKRLVKTSATILAALTGAVFIFVGLSAISCDGGNMLYGYGSACRPIPQWAANLSLPALLLVTPTALVSMILCTVIAAIMNRRDRANAPQ